MNRVTERCDLLVQKVNMGKLHGQEAAMMVTDPPREGLLQQWELAPHPTLGERCHRHRVCLAGNECLEHHPPRDAHNVRHHRGQFNIGPFQDTLDAVDFARPLLHQLDPVPGQVTQVTLACWRDETRLQQAVPHELGDPAGICLVRLPPGHVFDMRITRMT